MSKDGVDLCRNDDPGYRTVVRFGSWRVALANDAGWDHEAESLPFWQKHRETDEVFCLLEGQCTLFTAGNGADPDGVTAVRMEPGVVYNIRKGFWHARTLAPGSRVLIVENVDTGADNSENRDTTDEDRAALTAAQKEVQS